MLWTGRGDSAVQLCREFCYSPAAMTRMLDRLERKCLVRRLPHPASRRAHLLELTAEGQRVFPEMRAVSAASIEHCLGDFDITELNPLEALLGRMQFGT